MPEANTSMYNLNLASHADNVATYVAEMSKMASGDLPHLSPADRERVQGYLNAMKTELDYINNFPQLDLPHHDPRIIELNPIPDQREFENQFLTTFDRLLRAYHRESTLCVSARDSSGIVAPDFKRLDDILSAAVSYDSQYVDSTNPIDSPETGGSTGATGSEGNS